MNGKNNGGQVTVDCFVGGSGRGYILASNADVLVAIDSRDEIERLPERPDLIKVPVGEGDTVLSLLERLQEALPEAQALLEEYRHRPNVHLAQGMAQDPRLGKLAVKGLLLKDEEDAGQTSKLEKVFDRILARVHEASNGELSLLTIRGINSNAGGMGGGGGNEACGEFCAFAERIWRAKIRYKMIHFGGLTYVPLTHRVLTNVGKVVPLDLKEVCEHPSAGQLRDLELYELPLRRQDGLVIRDDRPLRDQLVGLLLQARFAPGVTELLEQRESNEKTTNPLGGILRVRAGWSRWLDQELLIRAAASSYQDQMRDLRMRPDPAEMTIAAGVEVELEPQGSPLPTVEEVMEAIREGAGADCPLLDRLRNAEPQRFKDAVLVRTPQDKTIPLDEVLGEAGRPKDLEECRSLCRRFRGVIAHLEQAHERAKETHRAAKETFEKRRRKLVREIRRALSSLRRRLEGILLSRRQVLQRLRCVEKILVAYCEAYERYSEAQARAEALAAAPEKMRRELARYEELWIARVEHKLEEAAGRRVCLDIVEFAPLEAVYSGLLDAALCATSATAWGPMRIALIRSVCNVTLKGLGEMLQTDPEPGAIVAALEEKERFPWESPLWGGEVSHVEPRYRCMVFPPLVVADLEDLHRAAKERHIRTTLVTAATAAAGCGIVELSFFPVTQRNEVLSPLYATYAKKASAWQDEESPALSPWQSGNGKEVQAKTA